MSQERDPDLPAMDGEADDEQPSDLGGEEPSDLGDEIAPDIRDGDLTASRADPAAVAPTSDPHPDAIDADFEGRPLTDDEVAGLAVEEADEA